MVAGSTHQGNLFQAAAMLDKLLLPLRLVTSCNYGSLLGTESIEHRSGWFCETIMIIRTSRRRRRPCAPSPARPRADEERCGVKWGNYRPDQRGGRLRRSANPLPGVGRLPGG